MKKAFVSTLVMVSFFLAPGCEKTGVPGDSKTSENRQIVDGSQCIKGILVKKGICGQRVIKLPHKTKQELHMQLNGRMTLQAKPMKMYLQLKIPVLSPLL